MSTNVLSNVGLIFNVCEKSPRNTKVIGTETGAVPWQILRPPQCDDRKGGTLQQEVAQSSQRRRRASFPVIDATSAAVVVPVDRRRRCSPHISPFPFPLRRLPVDAGEGANKLLLVVTVVPRASSPSRSVPAPPRITRVPGTIVRACHRPSTLLLVASSTSPPRH